jgi:hypothetical protein
MAAAKRQALPCPSMTLVLAFDLWTRSIAVNFLDE